MSVCVVGSLNIDIVSRVRALPQPGETVLATAVTRHVGGKGANQAVAAVRAGVSTRLIGCVGTDDDGRWLLDYLSAAGVDVSAVVGHPTVATGQAFITIDSASENTIVVSSGANGRWSGSGDWRRALAGSRVLLTQLELDLDVVEQALSACDSETVRILNAAPASRRAASLIPVCDLLVVNQIELALYADAPAHAPDERDLSRIEIAARRLLSGRCRSVIVTLGGAGVLLIDGDGAFHIASHPVEALDTVGAGDCFCGVLAAGLAHKLPLLDAARHANVAAALAVTRAGAAEAMPTRAEIDAAWAPPT